MESVLVGAVVDGPPRLLCFLDPQLAPGYIAWIAHDGEQTHLGVGGYAARFDPLTALEALRSRVANLIDLHDRVSGLRATTTGRITSTSTAPRSESGMVGGIGHTDSVRRACIHPVSLVSASGSSP